MSDNIQLITFLQELKKQAIILNNMVLNGAPQVDSYHINSKTSFLKDKIENLNDCINDILIEVLEG